MTDDRPLLDCVGPRPGLVLCEKTPLRKVVSDLGPKVALRSYLVELGWREVLGRPEDAAR